MQGAGQRDSQSEPGASQEKWAVGQDEWRGICIAGHERQARVGLGSPGGREITAAGTLAPLDMLGTEEGEGRASSLMADIAFVH